MLIIAVLVFTSYFNALGGQFLSDDFSAILNNPLIHSFQYASHSYFLISPVALIYFLITLVFGLNPFFFHLSNILFHFGSAILILTILKRFFPTPIPLFTAVLFAVHPVLTEAVTWISGSAYVQMTFYILASFLTYILGRDGNRKYYLLSLFFCFLALATSERAIVLPAIIIFYEFCRGGLLKKTWRLIPYCLLGAYAGLNLVGAFQTRSATLATSYYQEKGIDNPLVIIPIAISSYLGLIFFPKDLSFYHTELVFSQIQFWLMVGVTIFFLALTTIFWVKDKRIFFWLGFSLVSLAPYLTPFRISWIVAERYLYLGSIGIFVLIAYWISKIKWAWVIMVVIVFLLTLRTISRNFDYTNQDSLWLATAKTAPSSPQNHNNLGDYYGRMGNLDKSVEEFKTAIYLKPNYGDAYHNLGNVYRQEGQDDLAIQNYRLALKFNPRLWQSYLALASIYYQQQATASAEENLKMARELNPNL